MINRNVSTESDRGEARFRRLLDSGIIGVFEWNESGQILEGNGAFLQMLG